MLYPFAYLSLKNNTVKIYGINGTGFAKDISKLLGTTRFSNQVLKSNSISLQFSEFFLPEMFYLLDLMIRQKGGYMRRYKLQRLQSLLKEDTWLKDIDNSHEHRLDLTQLNDFSYPPLDYQRAFLEHYSTRVKSLRLDGMLLNAAAGSGKAQPLDSSIKIPKGWKTMGEMKVGDPIIAKDGTEAKVIGVFPQGLKDIFKITFMDGRTTECCGDHLWRVYNQNWKSNNNPRVVTTFEVMELLKLKSIKNRIFINLIDPEDGVDVDLPLDPYTLGVFLGDGCLRAGAIKLSNPDEPIIDKLRASLFSDHVLTHKKGYEFSIRSLNYGAGSNLYLNIFRDLGLADKLSYEKFIPDCYFHGSLRQRLALIQGLMDTDGTADKQGTSSYSTTSFELAKGIQYLIRSIGGIASISIKNPKYTYNGEKRNGRPAYQVNIRHKRPKELFTLPKKQDRVSNENQYANYLKLRMLKIDYVGQKEAQCIAIDHPDHLYVTDKFIATHNTYVGLALGHCLHADRIIIISPLNAVTRVWEANIKSIFKTPQTYWLSNSNTVYKDQRIAVIHYQSLKYGVELAQQFKQGGRVVIVVDESHNFNELKSAQTQHLITLCKLTKAEDILFSSGTPIKALGTEAVPLLTAIDPLFTNDVADSFKRVFNANNEMCGLMLRSRLGMISFKVEKAEIGVDKPQIQDIKVKAPDGDRYTLVNVKKAMDAFIKEREAYYDSRKKEDQKAFDHCIETYRKTLKTSDDKKELEQYLDSVKEIYKAYRKKMLKEVKDIIETSNRFEKQKIIPNLPTELRPVFKEVKTLIKYPGLKIQGECLGRILGGLRIDCYSSVADHFNYAPYIDDSLKKVVIFASFTKTCEIAERRLREMKYQPIGVYGNTTSKLADSVGLFEKDEQINPLIATYQSLSTAVPLTMANTIIMLNQPYRSYIQDQAIARIWRKGADSALFVFQVILDTDNEPNLSTRGIDIVEWSQKQVELLTGTESVFKEKNSISEDGTLTIANESYDLLEEVVFPTQTHFLNRW